MIYSVPEAARLLGISERAVRKRIATGALDADREGNGPWQVRLGVAGAVPVGTGGGTEDGTSSGQAEPIEGLYTTLHPPSVALVPLAAVADQLQAFADRLAEVGERNEALALEVGTLRERTATQEMTIDELRSQLAEAEKSAPASPLPPVARERRPRRRIPATLLGALGGCGRACGGCSAGQGSAYARAAMPKPYRIETVNAR